VELSEKQAKEKGIRYRVAKMPMSYVARAIEMNETRGLMKVLVEQNSDKILGCAILGIDGGEIMAILQVAMMGDIPYTKLRDGIFAHPTLAESMNNLFMSMDS
jgi:pyruvate/2-oxoglutarate dehydrogenase complex dihydrolipoamide dehydrogenase (E3) component